MSRSPSALRGLLWRVGVGTPDLGTLKSHVGQVAAQLGRAETALAAARALGISGLYRTPALWNGDARRPPATDIPLPEWAARCQAASFEIAVPLGASAVPFVADNAFGPLAPIRGLALRAMLRLAARGAVDGPVVDRTLESLESLEPYDTETALDGLAEPLPEGPSVRRRLERGLDRLAERARDVRTRVAALDPLARCAPERARRFLPDLRRLLLGPEHALHAALLIRAIEPRDPEAREVLRRLANEHPDPEIREALEAKLRPPRIVPGGLA